MPKEFRYRGFSPEELQEMPLEQVLALLPSRARRTLNRDLSHEKKRLIERVRAGAKEGKTIKTHARDMVILPFMVGITISVYNGKEFIAVEVKPQMIGHYLGEYSMPIHKVVHGTPGIGASRSSLYVPLK